jgi:hypothetical protein
LEERITDKRIVNLLKAIITSFNSRESTGLTNPTAVGFVRPVAIGLPLGNLTSQLFCNIYMNDFDQFVKHKLKVKYYIRYADDFVIFSQDKKYLENVIYGIAEFLNNRLKLALHPDKVFIKTLSSGMDFLGWVHFFDYRVLRTVTKKRMFKKLKEDCKPPVVNSYLGFLKHGNTGKIKDRIMNNIL